MPEQRRKWPTDKEKLAHERLVEQLKKMRDDHIAKYGEHVCTPNPNDPWSSCHLEEAW